MESFFGLSEATLRLSVFIGVFFVMAVAETLVPRRELSQSKPRRWFTNLGLVVIDSVVVRFTFPLVAVGVAVIAETRGWGVLAFVDWPVWLKTVIAVLVLDLSIYVQHVVTHKIPILWRLHQVHHVDRDIDVTTGTRFHPIEIILSMAYKMVVVVALGASPAAVVIFEVVLNAMAMFNHANFDLGRKLDGLVRLVVVTPDMHRVHHSDIREETDSNYGFNLSIWDRLFRTYRSQPRLGHIDMNIGQSAYRDEKPANLVWSLLLPFFKPRR